MPLDLANYSSVNSTNCIHSDIPVLEEQSWPDLWTGLFSSDFSTANIHLGLSQDESTNFAVLDAEESIETWAAQNLPLSQSLSTPPEAADDWISLEGLTTDPSEELCYGMVCYYTHSSYFFIRLSVTWIHGLITGADLSCSCETHGRHVRSRIEAQLGDYVPSCWTLVIRHNEVHSSALPDI